MYQEGFYSGLTEEEVEQRVKSEGFTPIKFNDPPSYTYFEHTHAETKVLAFLEGEMIVKVGDETFKCKAGDKLVIAPNTPHSAVVGSNGCTFFWSEKLLEV